MQTPKTFLVVPSVKLPRFGDKLLSLFAQQDPMQHPEAVIIDLEDSVPPEKKNEGRRLVSEFLQSSLFGQIASRGIWLVKTNDMQTPYISEDLVMLRAMTEHYPNIGLALPKINEISEMEEALKRSNTLPKYSLPTLETVQGFANRDILFKNWATLGIRFFAFGAGDMSYDLDVERDYSIAILNFVLISILVSAKINQIDFVDSPSRLIPSKEPHVAEQVEKECRYVFQNGGRGKIAIHPSQLPIINRAFCQSDVEHAQILVDLFDSNTESRAHVDPYTHQYVGTPSYKQAQQILTNSQNSV